MDAKLAMKIYNVMCASESLKKDMSVAGQYKAISESEVLNAIKPLLKEQKLILVPIQVDVSQSNKLTQLTAQYKIVDVETGEEEILATVGNGADSQDKGSGKAWTYAYKALIQKTFCLFSGEDTDNTHSDEIDNNTHTSNSSKISADDLFDAIEDSPVHTIEEVLKHYNDNRKEGTRAVSEIKYLPQTAKQYYYTKCKGESK